MSDMSHPLPPPDTTQVVLTLTDDRRVEVKHRVLEALRTHGTITKAAAAAGVTPRTVQRWQNDDADFKKEIARWLHVDQADELAHTLYEITKMGLSDARYATAAVKAGEILLKSLARDEFGDQQKIETTTTINAQVQVVVDTIDGWKQEQRERLQSLRAQTIDAVLSDSDKENE